MRAGALLHTNAPPATILIRVMVGAVFLSEGVQKFLFPEALGPGRFMRMGFANPEFWATIVGVFEIAAGVLIVIGLMTRPAALATATIMIVAIITTKIPIMLGSDLGPFQVRSLDTYGFLSMAHEARTDFAMLLGSLFLMLAGAGPLSGDAMLAGRRHGVGYVPDAAKRDHAR